MNTLIGERIKYHRERLSLTQEELGQKIGVTGVTIMRYEKGQREPSFNQIEALSEFFDVSPSYLVGWEEGSRLSQVREQAGLSQEELASKANISVNDLKRFEENVECPSDEILYSLAKICGVSPNYLFYPSVKFQTLGQRLIHIRECHALSKAEVCKLSGLSSEELEKLESLVDFSSRLHSQIYVDQILRLARNAYHCDMYAMVSGAHYHELFDQAIRKGIISHQMVADYLHLPLNDVELYSKNFSPNPISNFIIINSCDLIFQYDEIERLIRLQLQTLTPYARQIAADRLFELSENPLYRRKDIPHDNTFSSIFVPYSSFNKEIFNEITKAKENS